MNRIKQTAVTSTNFVKKHRVAIAVAVTFVATASLNRAAMRQHNEFLKEHNLFDAFYTPEDL